MDQILNPVDMVNIHTILNLKLSKYYMTKNPMKFYSQDVFCTQDSHPFSQVTTHIPEFGKGH